MQPENRYVLVTYILSAQIIACFYIIIKYYLNYKNLFNNSSNKSIARLIGNKFSNIKDKLINAYELENNLKLSPSTLKKMIDNKY